MEVLTFDVGGLACAVGVGQVREVLAPRPVTQVPGAPPAAPAVFALRGAIVTVIDLAHRLGVAPSGGRPEWLVVDGPAGVGACALRTGGVIGLSSLDPATLARPRGLAAAEDLLLGVHLHPDGPLLVLDLDGILDPAAVRRASLPRATRRPVPAAPVSARRASVAPSAGASPSPPQGDAPRVTPGPAAELPARRVSPRPEARPAAPLRMPAAPPTAVAARVERRAALVLPTGSSRDEHERNRASPRAEPVERRASGAATRADTAMVERREAVRAPHRAHAGVLAASAVAAAVLAAVLVPELAPPRIAPDPRAVGPSPDRRGVEREVVDSPPPVAPERLAPRSEPSSGSSGPPAAPVARPSPAPPGPFVVVARGDSLWRLAGVHLGAPSAWPRLHDLNRAAIADPDRIVAGQHLALPARGR